MKPKSLLRVVLEALPAGRSLMVRAPYHQFLTTTCNRAYGAGRFRTKRAKPGVWTVTRLREEAPK